MGRLGRTAKAFKGANTPGRNDESWLLKEPRFSALPSHASFFFSSFTFLDAPACRRGDDWLRGSASSRQEAWVLRSPIIRPWARTAAQRPVPGFLPSRAPSSGVHRIVTERYRAERLLRARHSPYICDKTDMVLPSGFLQLREGDVAKEMTGHHTSRATRENDSAL